MGGTGAMEQWHSEPQGGCSDARFTEMGLRSGVGGHEEESEQRDCGDLDGAVELRDLQAGLELGSAGLCTALGPVAMPSFSPLPRGLCRVSRKENESKIPGKLCQSTRIC